MPWQQFLNRVPKDKFDTMLFSVYTYICIIHWCGRNSAHAWRGIIQEKKGEAYRFPKPTSGVDVITNLPPTELLLYYTIFFFFLVYTLSSSSSSFFLTLLRSPRAGRAPDGTFKLSTSATNFRKKIVTLMWCSNDMFHSVFIKLNLLRSQA